MCYESTSGDKGFQMTLPLLLQGFRKNTSLVDVNIDIAGFAHREWLQKSNFFCQRIRSTALSKEARLGECHHCYCWFVHRGEWLQELKLFGQRNRFNPLLKASDAADPSPRLGIWSRVLANVATEEVAIFYVLRNKPKLVGSAGNSKKRKCDDE
jgi:hypothetical protein